MYPQIMQGLVWIKLGFTISYLSCLIWLVLYSTVFPCGSRTSPGSLGGVPEIIPAEITKATQVILNSWSKSDPETKKDGPSFHIGFLFGGRHRGITLAVKYFATDSLWGYPWVPPFYWIPVYIHKNVADLFLFAWLYHNDAYTHV